MTLPLSDTVPANPFAGLVRSRAFWLLILDTVVSTILFFAGKYAGAAVEDIKFLVVVYQPIFGLVITKMTVEDAIRVRSSAQVQVAQHEARSAVDVAAVQGQQAGLPRSPDRPISPRP